MAIRMTYMAGGRAHTRAAHAGAPGPVQLVWVLGKARVQKYAEAERIYALLAGHAGAGRVSGAVSRTG